MDLTNKTLVELRELAKQHGMKGVTALRKPELIERLNKELEHKEKRTPQKKPAGKYTAPARTPERKPSNPRKGYVPGSQDSSRADVKKGENGWPRRNARPAFHSTGHGHRQAEAKYRPQENGEAELGEHRPENAYVREQRQERAAEQHHEHHERQSEPRQERVTPGNTAPSGN